MLSPSQQQQINKIDRLHSDLDNTEKIWHILEEITISGLKESERQKQTIASLENNPAKYLEWLIKNLQRLLDINIVRKKTSDLLAENLEMVLSFWQKEKLYSKNTENYLNLARLYVNSENYYLARPLLEELCRTADKSGEVHFLQGCTSLQFNENTKAENHFKTALTYDPDIAPRIEKYRQAIGDEFFSFAQHFKNIPNRDASIKYSLRKGLLLCPLHAGLKNELKIFLNKDLKEIKSFVDKNDYESAAPLINEWHGHIIAHEYIVNHIPEELLKKIFFNHGKLQLSLKKYPAALESFKTALKFSPEDHDLYFILIDTYFVAKDFNGAIEAITEAIAVDVKFAAYWETIGDQLQEGGQHEDAITAYERCFTHLPENMGLIKKIGDCYMAAGHLEEAKAAYELMKQQLDNTSS